MALTHSVQHTSPAGNVERVVDLITFDNSYVTGGYAVAAGDFLNMKSDGTGSHDRTYRSIVAALVSGVSATGRPVYWNATTGKLQVFSAIGTEVANAVDLSADSVLVEWIGRP